MYLKDKNVNIYIYNFYTILILISVSVKDSSSLHLYKEIVDFYTTEEVWYSSIEVTEDTPLTQAQRNVVQCCLLMEGLGYIAQNLQRDYDRYLLKTLYLILERAGTYFLSAMREFGI